MSRPIRLLIAAQPLDGGVARHVSDLVACLPRDTFAIHVACPRESDVWKSLAGRADVRLHPISPARAPGPWDLVTLARLIPLVRDADVIHAHSSKAGFLARLAALMTGRRRRCFFTPGGWSFWSADGLTGRFYSVLERFAARWCRTIVAVSVQERDAGLREGIGSAAQYVVVPNGIAVERFAAEPKPVQGRIIMVSRLAAPKRQDLLLRALAQLRSRFADASLLLVGDGPQRDALQGLVDELGLRDAVQFTGARSDVPEILATASCVAIVSDYEGAPYSLLEGMAAGAAVVANSVGGIPEVIDDGQTGILVPPGDPEALTEALARVLADPTAAAEMGAAARRAVCAHYTHDAMARRLVLEYVAAAHEQ